MSADGDDELGRLLHDFSCAEPDMMLCDEMAATTRYLKENGEGGSAMCKIVEEIVTEKVTDAKLDAVRNIMNNLHLNACQAMDALEIPEAERDAYLEKLKA